MEHPPAGPGADRDGVPRRVLAREAARRQWVRPLMPDRALVHVRAAGRAERAGLFRMQAQCGLMAVRDGLLGPENVL
jgi:hypothetical protein